MCNSKYQKVPVALLYITRISILYFKYLIIMPHCRSLHKSGFWRKMQIYIFSLCAYLHKFPSNLCKYEFRELCHVPELWHLCFWVLDIKWLAHSTSLLSSDYDYMTCLDNCSTECLSILKGKVNRRFCADNYFKCSPLYAQIAL